MSILNVNVFLKKKERKKKNSEIFGKSNGYARGTKKPSLMRVEKLAKVKTK